MAEKENKNDFFPISSVIAEADKDLEQVLNRGLANGTFNVVDSAKHDKHSNGLKKYSDHFCIRPPEGYDNSPRGALQYIRDVERQHGQLNTNDFRFDNNDKIEPKNIGDVIFFGKMQRKVMAYVSEEKLETMQAQVEGRSPRFEERQKESLFAKENNTMQNAAVQDNKSLFTKEEKQENTTDVSERLAMIDA